MEFLWCIVLNYFLTFKVVFQEPVGWCKINYEVKISWGLFTFVSVRSCICKLSTFLQTSVPQIGPLYFTCHHLNWRMYIPELLSLEEVKWNIYFEENWNKSDRLCWAGTHLWDKPIRSLFWVTLWPQVSILLTNICIDLLPECIQCSLFPQRGLYLLFHTLLSPNVSQLHTQMPELPAHFSGYLGHLDMKFLPFVLSSAVPRKELTDT